MHPSVSSYGGRDKFAAQVRSRMANDRAVIENPLAHMTDAGLQQDAIHFAQVHLPSVPHDAILRAAWVAKDKHLYDRVAQHPRGDFSSLPVRLSEEEREALLREKNVTFSERGMYIVIATVSVAALLQGFVQSSFNGASLYVSAWDLNLSYYEKAIYNKWFLGAANSSPWFVAALVGCPLSLPVKYWFGRRGTIMTAAFLILASSIGAIFATNWRQLCCVRVVNGLEMGIKAVSTPILASETAIEFWRGSAILAWQFWVAFGIMLGFAFNMIFTNASSESKILALIQGAPLVPSLALLILARYCPEPPRYHLQKGPNYNVEKAYRALRRVRNTELQALRDLYLVWKALEQERFGAEGFENPAKSPGFLWVMRDFFTQIRQLFQQRRLYNALISASTVNLAQQLCGGTIFNNENNNNENNRRLEAMAYSLGFVAINFLFALPAVKSIDTMGRRKWLLVTLPFISLFMLGAGLCGLVDDAGTKRGLTALFFYLFAIAYSPGLGPIPFTLASESFPLSHREAGTACAIATNLFFAGLLSICYPSIDFALGQAGSLGFFSRLNVVALVLVFLLVEETKRMSLEELDHVAVSKRKFMHFQLTERLPWLMRRYLLGAWPPRRELYKDQMRESMELDEHGPQLEMMGIGGARQPPPRDPTSLEGEASGQGGYAANLDDGSGYSSRPPPLSGDWPLPELEARSRPAGHHRGPSAVSELQVNGRRYDQQGPS